MEKTWTINLHEHAEKALNKLHAKDISPILLFLERLNKMDNPLSLATKLQGHKNIYRFRRGDYRLICEVEHDILTILIVEVAHRKKVYRKWL